MSKERTDTERLDWLERYHITPFFDLSDGTQRCGVSDYTEIHWRDSLREAIDAAMDTEEEAE